MDRIGYGSPPVSTRFKKGQSGNPRGRPVNRHTTLPYETVLGQMVVVREDGRERRVSAEEAFLLHLTRKELQGDSAAARASLDAIETARAGRAGPNRVTSIVIRFVGDGLGFVLEKLGIATKTNRHDAGKVRYWLRPWIVKAALARLGARRLTPEEQREVWGATETPQKVDWPDWWTERRPAEAKIITRRAPPDVEL